MTTRERRELERSGSMGEERSNKYRSTVERAAM